MSDTEVYAVGLLSNWKRRRWQGLKQTSKYVRRQAKYRNWRAIRNTFNGYLAEHDGHAHNCGKGWTKRRALKSVERLCSG